MRRFFSSIFSFFLFCFSMNLQGKESFVIGTTTGYAPYVSLNTKGEYEGFDIDIAHLIAQKLNKKLIIKDLGTMPGLMIGLQQKKIDAIIWAVSITPARQKELSMIYYQGEKETHMPFLFWKNLPENIKKIEDLAAVPNRVICVEAGSSQDAVLQQYPNLKLRFLDKIVDAIMSIKYGKAFSAVVDASLINRLKTQYPELKTLDLELPPDQQSLGCGICIHKSNQQLHSQVAKIISDLQASGEIARLEKKWNLAR